jgi:hypothetical protein
MRFTHEGNASVQLLSCCSSLDARAGAFAHCGSKEALIKFYCTSAIPSGAKAGCGKGLILILGRREILQGLKPGFILLGLRPD